ncbi:MAG: dihydroorotate dehydrogenase electron transfer subunit [Bacillota bacterium]
MPLKVAGRVLENIEVAASCYHMVVDLPGIAALARPGQFLHLRCGTTMDPLLRRPLSLHWVDKILGQVGFLYQIVGKGTQWLSRLEAGVELDVVGPLGNGFPLDLAGKKLALVGGGIGVAPLLFLTREAVTSGTGESTVYIGARTARNLVAVDSFRSLGVKVRVATDDGSTGLHGTVTDLLKLDLQEEAIDHIIGCGPHPMLRALQEIATGVGVSCHISLEERMACGVGACRGCVVKLQVNHRGEWEYANVCDQGPVFDAREVVLR